MAPWRYVVLAALTGASALLVALSGNAFYLASGSDAGVDLLTPAAWVKWLMFGATSAALVWALLGRRAPRLLRWALYGVFVVLLGVATHAVVLNHKHGVVQEHWYFAVFDRARYDVAEGPAHDFSARSEGMFVVLQSRASGQENRVFTGFGPFRVDLQGALSPP